MKATGLEPSNLARRANVSPSTLTRFLAGKGPSMLRRATIDKISAVSGVQPPTTITAATLPAAAPWAPPPPLPRDVPIHALIGAPVLSGYYWNPAIMDYAPRPPALLNARRAFAVRMPDDTMEGWRRPNELIYLDPMRAVAEGDHALIQLTNDTAPDGPDIHMIRRLVRRRGKLVTLGNWGYEPSEETLPHTRIVQMIRVIEWPELLRM